MQELQVIDDKKINKIYEIITTDELTRESFEKDLIEATEKYKDYIPTAGTLKDDKAKRAEFNKLIESKNRIRIDTKTYYQRQLTHGIVMLSQLLTHLQP